MQSQEKIEDQDLPINAQDVLKTLDGLNISYDVFHHDPIFTVAEGVHLKAEIPGVHCRNLFLRDKKKRSYLVVAANETEIDLKKLPDLIGSGRLSFGSADRLWEMLGIRPGSVNPFCILNDPKQEVALYLDQAMMSADIVNYHPMDNAMTIGLSPADLVKFVEAQGRAVNIIDLSITAPE